MHDWLDKHIEEQKHNTDIMKKISKPYSPAELQDMKEQTNFEE